MRVIKQIDCRTRLARAFRIACFTPEIYLSPPESGPFPGLDAWPHSVKLMKLRQAFHQFTRNGMLVAKATYKAGSNNQRVSSTISNRVVMAVEEASIAETLQYLVSDSSIAWATDLGSSFRPLSLCTTSIEV